MNDNFFVDIPTYNYKNLLDSYIESTNQCTSKYINICVPYSYYIIENKNIILDEYHNNANYKKFINNIYNIVGKEKYDANINDKQLFINDNYILQKYGNIYNNSKYKEIILMIDNNLIEILNNITCYVIINRANETFPIIKHNNKFYCFDSHQNYHGEISLNNIQNHITYNNNFQGMVELLYN